MIVTVLVKEPLSWALVDIREIPINKVLTFFPSNNALRRYILLYLPYKSIDQPPSSAPWGRRRGKTRILKNTREVEKF